MTDPYFDTSALAKWYLNEARSDEVEAYLGKKRRALISDLTRLEMRCLLARRKRSGDFDAQLEAKVFSVFQQDIAQGFLEVRGVEGQHFVDAVNLISALPEHALRSLDALHLAIARSLGVVELATADHIMAKAANSLGLHVVAFGR